MDLVSVEVEGREERRALAQVQPHRGEQLPPPLSAAPTTSSQFVLRVPSRVGGGLWGGGTQPHQQSAIAPIASHQTVRQRAIEQVCEKEGVTKAVQRERRVLKRQPEAHGWGKLPPPAPHTNHEGSFRPPPHTPTVVASQFNADTPTPPSLFLASGRAVLGESVPLALSTKPRDSARRIAGGGARTAWSEARCSTSALTLSSEPSRGAAVHPSGSKTVRLTPRLPKKLRDIHRSADASAAPPFRV